MGPCLQKNGSDIAALDWGQGGDHPILGLVINLGQSSRLSLNPFLFIPFPLNSLVSLSVFHFFASDDEPKIGLKIHA